MRPRIKDFSAKHIADVCGVDITTARRWRRGAICPPKFVLPLLSGDLGIFSDYWRGWLIKGEYIVSPDQWLIRRNDALAVPLMHAQIENFKAELRVAKEQLAMAKPVMEEQPLPSEWDVMVG